MDFGHASTFAELVNIPEIQRIAEQFLSLINYYGIAEVEFMQDPRDGNYKLIEVNPRVWGWHTIAIASGVDLPYLLYQDTIGEEMDIRLPINHMKWVRLITDVPTVLSEIIKGRMKVGDYLKSMKGKKEFAVFALDDPLPFLAEIAMIPYLWLKRGF
jgi:predicted ATP-grasp superfamily ATP-dependent carboligase